MDGASSCAGFFEDVTVSAGVFEVDQNGRGDAMDPYGPGIYDFSAIFVDFDSDGWTDVRFCLQVP